MLGSLVLIVVLIAAIARGLGGGPAAPRGPDRTAREILDERFAKGEIDRQDYEQRRKAIES
jgi:putative membrane protein